jgi:ATP-dependent helicase Lhr and Lhr-like helicase
VSSPFFLLHPAIRHLTAEILRFPGLRPVQAMTIEPALEGRDLVVLAPTAGGKTEAAFFPILSRILAERLEPVAALYVSPLRALLNNVEPRVRRMAEGVGLSVGKWHGDSAGREKKAILAEPPHVLLITPESIEVLLILQPDQAALLLDRVRVVIVDEVHALAENARGAHLSSLLERLQHRAGRHVQRLGLSATVGAPLALARWLQGSGAVAAPVVVDPPRDARPPLFRFRATRTEARAAEIIRTLGAGKKRLVFVQGRRDAEALAGSLEALGVRVWVHHSSVGKEQRDEAEQAFADAPDPVLVATSSMELGIDVGDLDEVYQLDAPSTVSSLTQRLGRSGRRPGTQPAMTFLVDGPETLLVALAVTSLHLRGFVEGIRPSVRAWPVLVHQIFALVLETGGLTRGQIVARVAFVPAFAGLSSEEVSRLVEHLAAEGWLDSVDGVLVLGQRAEKQFGRRNFARLYSVFETVETLAVRHDTTVIGTLDRWFVLTLSPARPFFRLAGRSWKVVALDLAQGIVRVAPAPAGAAPQWSGRTDMLGRRVCEEVLSWMTTEAVPEGLDENTELWLTHARGTVSGLPLAARVRPLQRKERETVWHTFAGARINSVLARLVSHFGGMQASTSNLSVKIRSAEGRAREAALQAQEALVDDALPEIEAWADIDATKRGALLSVFQGCLPHAAEQAFLRESLLDVEGAKTWAGEVEL